MCEMGGGGWLMNFNMAFLIHDLRNTKSAAQPSSPLPHPLTLLQKTSFHGGLWRCPNTMTSITVPSAVHYCLVHYWPMLLLSVFMLGSVVRYVATGLVPSAPLELLQYFARALAVPLGDIHATSRLNSTGSCAA